MTNVARMSVSLDADLVEQFNHYCEEGRFATRSAAVGQLVREALAARSCEADDAETAATLTLVYDHHKANLTERLLQMQHRHPAMVAATLHVHLDHNNCLEVIVLRGRSKELREMADGLRGLKGVHTGQLVLAASTGAASAHPHHH